MQCMCQGKLINCLFEIFLIDDLLLFSNDEKKISSFVVVIINVAVEIH